MSVPARNGSERDQQSPEDASSARAHLKPGALPPIFTVGHSTRSIGEFVDLLRLADIGMVVDIRSVPRSRTNPQFNLDALPDALALHQIGHIHLAELGGLRSTSHGVSPATNGYWTNKSFHNYADHALSDQFRSGFERLLDLSRERRCALMCAEAVWWRCHRRIVADYLICRGRTVFHLMGQARIEPAKLNPAARCEGEIVTYPAGN